MWAYITGNIQHPNHCSLEESAQQFIIICPHVNIVSVKYRALKKIQGGITFP